MITSERYLSRKIKLDGEDVKTFALVVELAKRYVKLKKRGDRTNWIASEVVLDEFTAVDCEAIVEQLKKLETFN